MQRRRNPRTGEERALQKSNNFFFCNFQHIHTSSFNKAQNAIQLRETEYISLANTQIVLNKKEYLSQQLSNQIQHMYKKTKNRKHVSHCEMGFSLYIEKRS